MFSWGIYTDTTAAGATRVAGYSSNDAAAAAMHGLLRLCRFFLAAIPSAPISFSFSQVQEAVRT